MGTLFSSENPPVSSSSSSSSDEEGASSSNEEEHEREGPSKTLKSDGHLAAVERDDEEEEKEMVEENPEEPLREPSDDMFPYLAAAIARMEDEVPIVKGLSMKRSFQAVSPEKAAILDKEFKKIKVSELKLQKKMLNLQKETLKLLSSDCATAASR